MLADWHTCIFAYMSSYSIGLLSHISKISPMTNRLHILKKLHEGEIEGIGKMCNLVLHNVLVVGRNTVLIYNAFTV